MKHNGSNYFTKNSRLEYLRQGFSTLSGMWPN